MHHQISQKNNRNFIERARFEMQVYDTCLFTTDNMNAFRSTMNHQLRNTTVKFITHHLENNTYLLCRVK